MEEWYLISIGGDAGGLPKQGLGYKRYQVVINKRHFYGNKKKKWMLIIGAGYKPVSEPRGSQSRSFLGVRIKSTIAV